MINLNDRFNAGGSNSIDFKYSPSTGGAWESVQAFLAAMAAKFITPVCYTTILVKDGTGTPVEMWNPASPTDFVVKGSDVTANGGPIVEDVLTSDSSTNALSAKQGKLLKAMVDSKVKTSTLSPVATSGDYNDLTVKPQIPGVVDSLESESKTNALSAAKGKELMDAINTKVKPSDLKTVATSGKYTDLTDQPTIPAQPDVIDNLTSTVADDALSAKQGNVLNNAIGQLNSLSTAQKTSLVTAINELVARLAVLEAGGGGSVTNYAIINNLTGVSTNNAAVTALKDSAYDAVLSLQSGYENMAVTVTMGGTDITSTAWASPNVHIAQVTGNVSITATANEIAASKWSISKTLTGMTASDNINQVDDKASYTVTLTTSTGYKNPTVTVKMGGVDITTTAWVAATGKITISQVTGNVVITGTAVVDEGGSTGATRTLTRTDSVLTVDGKHFNGQTIDDANGDSKGSSLPASDMTVMVFPLYKGDTTVTTKQIYSGTGSSNVIYALFCGFGTPHNKPASSASYTDDYYKPAYSSSGTEIGTWEQRTYTKPAGAQFFIVCVPTASIGTTWTGVTVSHTDLLNNELDVLPTQGVMGLGKDMNHVEGSDDPTTRFPYNGPDSDSLSRTAKNCVCHKLYPVIPGKNFIVNINSRYYSSGSKFEDCWVGDNRAYISTLSGISYTKDSDYYIPAVSGLIATPPDGAKYLLINEPGAETSVFYEDGSATPTFYNITKNLTNVTSSNTIGFVAENTSYTTTLSVQSGYEAPTVSVTMGGTNITSTAYTATTGVISIDQVTGHIVITATSSAIAGTNWNISYALTGVSSTNSAATAEDQSSYTTTLSLQTGYENMQVTVKMGDTDVTTQVYTSSTGVVSINKVAGDIVITAIASEEGSGYSPRVQTLEYVDGYLDSSYVATPSNASDTARLVQYAKTQIAAADPSNKYLKVAVITDLHSPDLDDTEAQAHSTYKGKSSDDSIVLFGNIVDQTDVDAGFVLGDYVDYKLRDDLGDTGVQKYTAMMKKVLNKVRNAVNGPLFITFGNHEAGGGTNAKNPVFDVTYLNKLVQTINKPGSNTYAYYFNTEDNNGTPQPVFDYVVEFPRRKAKIAMWGEWQTTTGLGNKAWTIANDMYQTTLEGWLIGEMYHGVKATGGALQFRHQTASGGNNTHTKNLKHFGVIRGHVHDGNAIGTDLLSSDGITSPRYSLQRSAQDATLTTDSRFCVNIFVFNTDTNKTTVIGIGDTNWDVCISGTTKTMPYTYSFATD